MASCAPWAARPAARPGPWRWSAPRPGAAQCMAFELQDLAVATSGNYRRYLKVGIARLAHTMEARRAAPVNNTVASVTVLASSCMRADAWATAQRVAGPGDGLALAQRMGWRRCFCCAVLKAWWKWGWVGLACQGQSLHGLRWMGLRTLPRFRRLRPLQPYSQAWKVSHILPF